MNIFYYYYFPLLKWFIITIIFFSPVGFEGNRFHYCFHLHKHIVVFSPVGFKGNRFHYRTYSIISSFFSSRRSQLLGFGSPWAWAWAPPWPPAPSGPMTRSPGSWALAGPRRAGCWCCCRRSRRWRWRAAPPTWRRWEVHRPSPAPRFPPAGGWGRLRRRCCNLPVTRSEASHQKIHSMTGPNSNHGGAT